MAAVRRISTNLAVEGAAEYKQKLTSCNAVLKEMQSELARTESEFRNNANSMEALTAKTQALENVKEALTNKQNELTDAQAKAKAAQEEHTKRIEEAKESIAKTEAELEDLKNTKGNTTKQQKELNKTLEEYRDELAEAEGAQHTAAKEASRLTSELHKTEIELHKNADALEEVTGYLDEAANSFDGKATSIDEFGNKVKDSTEEVTNLGAALTAAGIAKLVKEIHDALRAAVGAFMDFEATLSAIQAQTGMTSDEMREMRGNIQSLAIGTRHSAMEIAQAYSEVARAGQDAAHGTEIMRAAMVLADATGESLSSSAYFLGEYLDKLGKDASYGERYLNVFAKTVQSTNMPLATMQDYLFRANATLQMANISGTEAAAVFGELYRNGVRGANAYSGFQQAVQSLLLPSAEAAAALDELGINTAELQAQGYSMMEVMFMVGDAMDGVTNNTDRLRLSQSIFTQQSAFAFSDELFTQRDTLRELIPELYKAGDAATGTGIAYQIAADRTDNLEASMQRLSNSASALQLAVGESLTPVIRIVADELADLLTWMAQGVDDCDYLGHAIIGLSAALGTLGVVAVLSTGKVKALIASLKALAVATKANPIGLVAAAVVGLGAALVTFAATQEDANAETRAFIETLDKSRQAHQDNLSSIDAHTGNINNLLGAFERLSAAEGHNEAQKRALQGITEELIQLAPELADHVDEYTGALNSSIEAIRAVTLAEVERDRIQAKVARLSQLYAEQVAVTEELEDAQLALALATAKTNNTFSDLDLMSGAMDDNQRAAVEAREAYNMLAAAAYELESEIAELEGTVSSHIEAQNEQAAAMEESARAAYEANAAYEAQKQYVHDLIDELDALITAHEESRQAAYDNITRTLGLFNTLSTEADRDIQDLIASLDSQITFMDNYAANIKRAMELAVDEGLIKKLSDGSEESARILQAIVDDGGENIDELNEHFERVSDGKEFFADTVKEMNLHFCQEMDALTERAKVAIDELAYIMEAQDEMYEISVANMQGLIAGAESKRDELIETYRSIARAIVAAWREEMAQKSPSRRMMELGANDIKGLIAGIESQKQRAIDAYKDTAVAGYRASIRAARTATSVPRLTSHPHPAEKPLPGDGGFTIEKMEIHAIEPTPDEQHRAAALQWKMLAREVGAI